MRILPAALSLACVQLFAATASAHAVNLSRSDFTVSGASVHALVVFAKPDAVRLGRMDPDGDGVVTPAELEASRAVFGRLVAEDIAVRADGAACAPTLEGGGDVEGDGFGLSIAYACPAPPRSLVLSMDFLRRLPPGHSHIAHVQSGDASAQGVLTADDPRLEITLSPEVSGMTPPPRSFPLRDAIRMGIAHILTGWDHLLFLFALLLGTRSVRSIVGAVSAFTVAHSITLALAASGILVPSPRLVEPAIAASIAWVAFENAFRPGAPDRWRLTFAFGLVHGFGFAGALRELALSRDRLAPTLFGFNVGVEIGQLLVIAAVGPLLALTLRGRATDAAPVRALSAAVGLVGVAAFIARVAFPA